MKRAKAHSKRKARDSAVDSKKKHITTPDAEDEVPEVSLEERRSEGTDAGLEESENNSKDLSSGDAAKASSVASFKDLLGSKQELIASLFLTISGDALQELIPDYLKNRSVEELKSLCLAVIETMSPGLILHILSGKDPSAYKETFSCGTNTEIEKLTEIGSQTEKSTDEAALTPTTSEFGVGERSNSCSSEALELCPSSLEMKSIIDEESPSPLSVEEVAKGLDMPDKDAELLELEMRARAIRSLLKARDSEGNE